MATGKDEIKQTPKTSNNFKYFLYLLGVLAAAALAITAYIYANPIAAGISLAAAALGPVGLGIILGVIALALCFAIYKGIQSYRGRGEYKPLKDEPPSSSSIKGLYGSTGMAQGIKTNVVRKSIPEAIQSIKEMNEIYKDKDFPISQDEVLTVLQAFCSAQLKVSGFDMNSDTVKALYKEALEKKHTDFASRILEECANYQTRGADTAAAQKGFPESKLEILLKITNSEGETLKDLCSSKTYKGLAYDSLLGQHGIEPTKHDPVSQSSASSSSTLRI